MFRLQKAGNLYTMSPQERKQLNLNKTYKALLDLLADHQFSDISVSLLCRKAGVSRTYYYRNYHSMQEIISCYQEMTIESYLRILPHKMPLNFIQLMTAYFQLMQNQSEETRLLVNAGLTNTLIKAFRIVYLYLTEQGMIKRLNNSHRNNKYFASFMSGAVISTQIQWLDQGMQETPAELGRMLNQLFFS